MVRASCPSWGRPRSFCLTNSGDSKRTYQLPKSHLIMTPGLTPSVLRPQKVLLLICVMAQICFSVLIRQVQRKRRRLGLSSACSSDCATDTHSQLALFIWNGIKIQARGLPALCEEGDGYPDTKVFSALHRAAILIILTIPRTNKMDSPVPQIFRNVS